MRAAFNITFPLVLKWDSASTITFTLQKGNQLRLGEGIYYLAGDNGSGKTTFINILSLTAGTIGKKSASQQGTIAFNGIAYSGKKFDHFRAAKIREEYFSIFPQKTFFLPVSTRDNYLIFNGSDKDKIGTFSSHQFPELLSGGQQQQILMDIVLDGKRPVWFLDEPLTNLDDERRLYFWETVAKAWDQELSTIFFIEHWLRGDIKKRKRFTKTNTLRVYIENKQAGKANDTEFKSIDLYHNGSPKTFFDNQISKSRRLTQRKKSPPLSLNGDWGATMESGG
jgi:ABC-type Mn2+/Zn2+ transport system ATPase subunit